jgi:DNA-binding CsgD family transcriptional regulator
VVTSIGFDFAAAEVALIAARLAEEAGHVPAARAAVDEAARLATGIGMPWYLAWVANSDGRVARAEGRPGAAEDAHHRALAICVCHGYAATSAETLECLASLAVASASWLEAARLYGAARGLRERTGSRRPVVDAPTADTDGLAIEAALGPERYAAAVAEGEALPLDGAAAYASRARGERKRPSSGWDSLTPMEQRVTALVAEGLTNPDIGRRLYITTGTVKVHLHNIFAKLGVARRSELAARATERRLGDT